MGASSEVVIGSASEVEACPFKAVADDQSALDAMEMQQTRSLKASSKRHQMFWLPVSHHSKPLCDTTFLSKHTCHTQRPV